LITATGTAREESNQHFVEEKNKRFVPASAGNTDVPVIRVLRA